MEGTDLRSNLDDLSLEINIPERMKPSTVLSDDDLNTIRDYTKDSHKKKKKFIVYVGAVLVGLVISSFLSYSLLSTENPRDIIPAVFSENTHRKLTMTPVVNISSGAKITEGINPSNGLIAYIADNNIWTIDALGKNSRSLTDASGKYTLKSLKWRDAATLLYSRCSFIAGTCDIVQIDTSSNKIKVLISLKDVDITAFTWVESAKSLFYHVYDKSDNTYKTYLYIDGESKIFKKWKKSVGKGLLLSDDISFDVNSDGSKVLFNNTLASLGDSYITIFDSNGIEVSSLIQRSMFGQFTNLSTYIYVNGSGLFLSDSDTPLVSKFDGLNPKMSPNSKSLVYWKYGEKLLSSEDNTYLYSIINKKETLLLQNFIKPKWLDQNTIIGLSTIKSDGVYNYQINGIVRLDINDGSHKLLVGKEIKFFDIQP